MAIALIGAICAAIAGYAIQSNVGFMHQLGVSGLSVPDAVSLRDTVNVYWARHSDPNVNAAWGPIIGVMRLYWVGIIWGSPAVCVLNVFLVLTAAYYFFEAISVFLLGSRQLVLAFTFVVISVAANAYVIEVMAFPNKEIPLMAITNAYIYYLLVRKNYIAGAALSIIAYAFRDGYGVILLMCLGGVWLLKNKPASARLTLIGAMLLLFILIPISNFTAICDVFARNVESGLSAQLSSPVNGHLDYLSRLKYNLIGLGFFSSLQTTEYRLNLLNVGFWQFGIFIIAGTLWSITQILKEASEYEFEISVVIIITLLCISYGSFVQPRYLMPLLYFMAFGFIRCIKCGAIAATLSIVIVSFLILSGILHRAPEMLDAVIWSW